MAPQRPRTDVESRSSAPSRIPAWVGPSTIGAAAVVMLILSWQKWPDLLIDFGQQLYLAWQMAEGRTLYVDLICNYGPLAPYANAWAFEYLGASVLTLVGLNLAVFLGITWFTYLLLLRIGKPVSAISSGIVLMLVFGFSQVGLGGNFNYATPYENSLTIGLLPALAALWMALEPRGSARRNLGVGFCLGLSFLTKPEVFLAGGLGVSGAWIAGAWVEGEARLGVLRRFSLAAVGVAVTILSAIGLLTIAMPLGTAVSGALGSWPAALGSKASELTFYRQGMGIENLGANLVTIGIAAISWVVVGVLVIGGGVSVARLPGSSRTGVSIGLLVLVVAVGVWLLDAPQWHAAARPLQFLMLAVAVVATLRLWGGRRDAALGGGPDDSQAQVARLAFALFAGALLLKMIFNVKVYHYGFVLAMPAGMIAVTALVDWIPSWVGRRGGHTQAAAAVSLALLIGFCQAHLRLSARSLAEVKIPVGEGANRILANERAHFVNGVLALIERLDPATVAVFPEGSIINFFSECPNPTPFYNFVPTGYAIFGEPKILDALRAHPPEVIVLCDRDTSEFGFRYFGTDYALETYKWILQQYQVERLFGAPPLQGRGYGIAVMTRRHQP